MDYSKVIEYSVGDDRFKAELDYVYVNGDEAMYIVYLQGGSGLSYCYNSYTNIQEIINKEKQMTQNIKQSTKPFNLQAALEGAPVMTANGLKVVRIVHFPSATKNSRVVALLEHGQVCTYHEHGNHCANITSDIDLVMVTTTKTGWVNVYKDGNNNYNTGDIYASYEEASGANKCCNCISTTKIEWEE